MNLSDQVDQNLLESRPELGKALDGAHQLVYSSIVMRGTQPDEWREKVHDPEHLKLLMEVIVFLHDNLHQVAPGDEEITQHTEGLLSQLVGDIQEEFGLEAGAF